MIGIALLGAGYAGRIQLEGWRGVPNARVVGIWNRTPGRARALADEFAVSSFDALDTLLHHPEVDAVDIATAMETHRDLALRAAAAGKHVLCQKPLAPTLAEAELLVAGCAAAGVRVMTNENWRWRPWYRAARGVLDREELGRPFYLRLALRSAAAVAAPGQPPERLFSRQPFLRTMRPLILLELGGHHLDVARWLFGTPEDVYARTLKVTPSERVAGEEVATLLLGYHDRLAQVELSWGSLGYEENPLNPDLLAIEGTEGSLFISADGQPRIHTRGGHRGTIRVDTTEAYRRSWAAALAHFADCLEQGTPFETSGEDNLTTLRLVFGGYESAATGLPVRLA